MISLSNVNSILESHEFMGFCQKLTSDLIGIDLLDWLPLGPVWNTFDVFEIGVVVPFVVSAKESCAQELPQRPTPSAPQRSF